MFISWSITDKVNSLDVQDDALFVWTARYSSCSLLITDWLSDGQAHVLYECWLEVKFILLL